MSFESIIPDHVFEGGDLDCGSGLVLLIREAMLKVPVDGILEMRSSEPTVADDLPPWCRMVGHVYLGSIPSGKAVRYFVRKSVAPVEECAALESDLERAKNYEWRVRARSTGNRKSTAYCRNFTIEVGQPASFEETDKYPSAVEYLLSSLAGDLVSGYFAECARSGLEVDDVEITVAGKLHNVLAHLGTEEGDPSVSSIELKCYATSFEPEEALRKTWERTVLRSPVASTLSKAVELKIKFAVV